MAAGSVVFSLLGILLLVVGPDAETRRTGVVDHRRRIGDERELTQLRELLGESAARA